MKSQPLYKAGQRVVAVVPDGDEGSPKRIEGRVERVEVRSTGCVYYQLDTRERLLPEDRITRALAGAARRTVRAARERREADAA